MANPSPLRKIMTDYIVWLQILNRPILGMYVQQIRTYFSTRYCIKSSAKYLVFSYTFPSKHKIVACKSGSITNIFIPHTSRDKRVRFFSIEDNYLLTYCNVHFSEMDKNYHFKKHSHLMNVLTTLGGQKKYYSTFR